MMRGTEGSLWRIELTAAATACIIARNRVAADAARFTRLIVPVRTFTLPGSFDRGAGLRARSTIER